MAKVVVLGAGISGHTAAAHLRRKLPRDHEVIVLCAYTAFTFSLSASIATPLPAPSAIYSVL